MAARKVVALSSAALLSSTMAVMDVGTRHVCATIGSTPKCWGDNKWGQLGREDNSTMIGDDPDEMGDNLVGVDVGGAVTEMALGESHTCMLVGSSGEVVCFGKNDAGQLGLGDTENRGDAPGSVGETVDFGAGLAAVAITSGCEHTCALLDDGSVKCFGENNYGQLGQGTTDNAGDDAGEMGDALAAVSLTGTVTAIAAGCDFTCALMDDGAVMCWGRNTWGQLGTGDDDDRLDGSGIALVAVDLDGSVATAIAAGEGHVCALLEGGSVKCWGLNNSGQLGQGEELDRRGDSPETLGANLPAIELGTGDVPAAIDCGSFHTCILLADDTVKCFGENGYGELGIGTTDNVGLLPADMGDSLVAAGVTGVEDVAAGGSTTCAVLSGDSIQCWGLGNDGQLGQGSDEAIADVEETEPVDAGSDTFALTPAPTATLPVTPTNIPSTTSSPSSAPTPSTAATPSPLSLTTTTTPSAAPTLPIVQSTAPTVAAAATTVPASAAPSAGSRQIGATAMPTMTPVTLAPLGPGETAPPTPAPTLEVGVEGDNGAPAHFSGGLLATIVLGSMSVMGLTLFL